MERLGIESPKIGGGFSDDDEDGGGNEMLALQGLANEVRRTRIACSNAIAPAQKSTVPRPLNISRTSARLHARTHLRARGKTTTRTLLLRAAHCTGFLSARPTAICGDFCEGVIRCMHARHAAHVSYLGRLRG